MIYQNLWGYETIPTKVIQIFSKNFLDFRPDTIEKQFIKNLSSYAPVVFSDFKVAFLGKEKVQPFTHFSIVFYL